MNEQYAYRAARLFLLTEVRTWNPVRGLDLGGTDARREASQLDGYRAWKRVKEGAPVRPPWASGTNQGLSPNALLPLAIALGLRARVDRADVRLARVRPSRLRPPRHNGWRLTWATWPWCTTMATVMGLSLDPKR